MIRNLLILVGKGLLLCAITATTSFGQRIFPGAEGFGTETRGAYAGPVEPRILIVDNLSGEEYGNESTGRGTLRWALTRSYPRIVVFEVSGTIDLNVMSNKYISVNNPYLTVYGQTAPAPGITLRGGFPRIYTHDILLQHLRIRNGNERSEDVDCIGMQGTDVYNIVIDHCSFSWANDELVGLNAFGVGHDITISNCIFGEPFHYDPDHSKYPSERGMGATIILAQRVSIVKNLFIHVNQRIPFINSDRDVFVTNNIIYNSPHGNKIYIKGAYCQEYFPGEPMKISLIGNIKKTGPAGSSYNLVNIADDVPAGSKVYMQDNVAAGISTQTGMVANYNTGDIFGSVMEVEPEGYSYIDTDNLEAYLSVHAGARPTNRDAVDIRLINDLINVTGSLINSQDEVGGWPVLNEVHVTLNIPANPHADDNNNGYSNLEDWAASLSEQEYKSATFNVRNAADNSPLNTASVQLVGYVTRSTNASGVATFSSLQEDKTYTYAVSKIGYTQATGSITMTDDISVDLVLEEIPDTEAPGAPQNLSGSPVSHSQINLNWSAATDNIGVAGYIIYRSGSEIGTTTHLYYSDVDLDPNTSYSYTVSAYDAAGNQGPMSNTVNIYTLIPPDAEPPSQPTVLEGNALSPTVVELKWDAVTDNVAVAGYNIFRDYHFVGYTLGEALVYYDSELNPESEYLYRISAFDGKGNESAYSPTITVTTPAPVGDNTPPAVPGNLQASDIDFDQISLEWSPSTDESGVVGYNIFRSNELIGITTNTNFTDVDLDPDTEYLYTVSAWDQSGNESTKCSALEVTTLSDAKIVYINPESTGFDTPNGSAESPYNSWTSVEWKEGYTYLQMRGTTTEIPKILVTAGNITFGAYGTGSEPVLISTADDYAMCFYDKSNVIIQDLDIRAGSAISALYFAGQCDNNRIERCRIEGSEYSIRIAGGNNFTIQYNELKAELNAVFTMAENTKIFYNEITKSITGIQVSSYNADVKVFNNVFYDNFQAISSSYGGLELYNNIFSLELPGSVAISSEMDDVISDYNIFYPQKAGFIEIAGLSYDDLQSLQSSTGHDMHSKSTDPGFLDPLNNLFSLNNNSPGINAGRDVGLSSDKAGSAVPIGPSPDIGVLETSVTTRLSNPSDTRDNLSIYPSPNDGNFLVNFDFPVQDPLEISIFRYDGKLISSTTAKAQGPVEFHLEDLPEATYFLKVKSNGKVYTEKFQIIH